MSEAQGRGRRHQGAGDGGKRPHSRPGKAAGHRGKGPGGKHPRSGDKRSWHRDGAERGDAAASRPRDGKPRGERAERDRRQGEGRLQRDFGRKQPHQRGKSKWQHRDRRPERRQEPQAQHLLDGFVEPELAKHVRANELPPSARNELKGFQTEKQDTVARHLVMAGKLVDEDPELARAHAQAAVRRASRIPVTRETLGIIAYRLGDFQVALREFRTYKRLTGRDDHIAFMVDCERGLGRPARGIELANEVDRGQLSHEQRVYLAIAVSGARLDLGQTQQALYELEIPELTTQAVVQGQPRVEPWRAELYFAYAAVLADLGREDEARKWEAAGERAEQAFEQAQAGYDQLEVEEIDETEPGEEATREGAEPGEVEGATSAVQREQPEAAVAEGESKEVSEQPAEAHEGEQPAEAPEQPAASEPAEGAGQ